VATVRDKQQFHETKRLDFSPINSSFSATQRLGLTKISFSNFSNFPRRISVESAEIFGKRHQSKVDTILFGTAISRTFLSSPELAEIFATRWRRSTAKSELYALW
jgi:hypothetical protein